MNKDYAMQILNEVSGTSPSYIREYGLSLVREAVRYMDQLNGRRKKPDMSLDAMINTIKDKISRIS